MRIEFKSVGKSYHLVT